MNFQGKVFALMLGICAAIGALILAIFVQSALSVASTNKAYSQVDDLVSLSKTSHQAQSGLNAQINDFKNVIIRGANPTAKNEYFQGFNRSAEQVNLDLQRIETTLTSLDATELAVEAKKVAEAHALFTQNQLKLIETYDTQSFAGQQVLDSRARPAEEAILLSMGDLVSASDSVVQSQSSSSSRVGVGAGAIKNLIIFILGALVAAVVVYYFINMVRQLLDHLGGEPEAAYKHAKHLADGDLNYDIEASSAHSLLGHLTRLQAKIKTLCANIDSQVNQSKLLILRIQDVEKQTQLSEQMDAIEAHIHEFKSSRESEFEAEEEVELQSRVD